MRGAVLGPFQHIGEFGIHNGEMTPSMFQLTTEEKEEVVTNCDHLTHLKFSPNLPFAFTGHGAIMAAAVLNSAEAVSMAEATCRQRDNSEASGRDRQDFA